MYEYVGLYVTETTLCLRNWWQQYSWRAWWTMKTMLGVHKRQLTFSLLVGPFPSEPVLLGW